MFASPVANSTPQLLAALREMPTARTELDQVEIGLIEVLMDRGLGWPALDAPARALPPPGRWPYLADRPRSTR